MKFNLIIIILLLLFDFPSSPPESSGLPKIIFHTDSRSYPVNNKNNQNNNLFQNNKKIEPRGFFVKDFLAFFQSPPIDEYWDFYHSHSDKNIQNFLPDFDSEICFGGLIC